jgi:hypothetical protein
MHAGESPVVRLWRRITVALGTCLIFAWEGRPGYREPGRVLAGIKHGLAARKILGGFAAQRLDRVGVGIRTIESGGPRTAGGMGDGLCGLVWPLTGRMDGSV